MGKYLFFSLFALSFVLTLGSCKQQEDASIEGTWILSNIQDVPVGALEDTSGTIVVNGDMSCTQQITLSGLVGSVIEGTVADNGDDNFTFTYVGDPTSYHATMSDGGHTLYFASYSILGSTTWTK
jgi:hypothetical protein